MNPCVVTAAVLAVWLTVSVLLALLVGAVVRLRDRRG